jgi:hypothetical protein
MWATVQVARSRLAARWAAGSVSNFADMIGELKDRLHRWTRGGQHGLLFDNAQDTLNFSRFQAFNFAGWGDAHDVLPPLLFYALHRASHEIADPTKLGTFKLFLLDETWLFIRNETIGNYTVQAQKLLVFETFPRIVKPSKPFLTAESFGARRSWSVNSRHCGDNQKARADLAINNGARHCQSLVCNLLHTPHFIVGQRLMWWHGVCQTEEKEGATIFSLTRSGSGFQAKVFESDSRASYGSCGTVLRAT